MSMTPPASDSILARWKRFWFAPGDPTTLGFIRIATGLLVIYLHLAYSLDMQAFFGRFGWYGSAYSERERKEQPMQHPQFLNWDESSDAVALVPEYPHRRAAVIRFIRSLPTDSAERARSIAYLKRVTDEPNLVTERLALNLVRRLYGISEINREAPLRDGLEAGKQWYEVSRNGTAYQATKPEDEKFEVLFPEFMLVATPEIRAEVARELRALLRVMPANVTDAEYLLAHIDDLDLAHRKALVKFMLDLPDDPAARAHAIDYLDYWNFDPARTDRQGLWFFSVWFHVTNPTEMNFIHGTIIAIMALFTIGFCTRVTSVLTWLAALSYLNRTNQVLFGMDTMMNILLIYLMVGNSGAALSVDRLIARYRAARASIRRCGTIDGPTRAFLAQAPASSGANLGIRLIQIHFCFIYMAAGLSKLKGPGWWDGTAFWDVMINPEFTMMKYPWFEDMVRAVVKIKPLYYAFTMLGVWFTWGLEISFPFLVWTRMRPVMVWMGVLLHAGIGMLMGLNVFELLMMTMLLVFFPPGVIRDRLRGSGTPKVPYGYDPTNPEQARAAAVVAAADVDGQVIFEPGKKTQPDAKSLFGSLRLLGVLNFLLWIPGVSGVVSKRLAPAARTA